MSTTIPFNKQYVFLFVFSLFALFVTCVPAFQSESLSFGLQLVATLTAFNACYRHAMKASQQWRIKWLLLAASMALSGCGVALAAWEELIIHKPFAFASLSDFAFFLFGVPILLAISVPAQVQRSPIFTYLNLIEVTFAGVLAYVAIFPEFPSQNRWTHPVSIALLIHTYDIENLVLAACCAVRVLAAPKGGTERIFYRTLLTFLLTFGLGLAVYERLAILTAGSQNFSVLVDLPYLLLALLIQQQPRNGDGTVLHKPFLALVVDNGSPVFFTLALLGLVLEILPKHMHLGMAAIGVALGAYGIRSTLLQIKLMGSEFHLMRARDKLEQMTLQDGLTGIANRRSFDQTLELEWYRTMRAEQPLSLMVIDLDFFKSLNDAQGHPSGDRCLRKVADALRSTMTRSSDLVARYGGEEFAVILPGTAHNAARNLAVQFQDTLRSLAIRNETPFSSHLTASIGIATHEFGQSGTPQRLVEVADAALYAAKRNGRNRIEVSSMDDVLSSAEVETFGTVPAGIHLKIQTEL
jgi:diguanylate cyclase (GGDEF)-like protein